jgi:RNA polymerase sigma-70 factor (ECF subfamily)
MNDGATLQAGLPDSVATPIDAGELFRRYAPFVAKFMFQLGVRPQDLHDMVQEVFLVAHRRGGFVPDRATPTTWLAAISFRVVSSSRRAKRHVGEELRDDVFYESAKSAVGPERAAETAESLGIVQKALDTLDVDKRTVFILYELEGESCEAIAEALGIRVGTVYSRLYAARREFVEAHGRICKARRGAP